MSMSMIHLPSPLSFGCTIDVKFSATNKHKKFTADEDRKLSFLVKLVGARDWIFIANQMPGRTSRQCRERWVNHLDPALKKDPWNDEEDSLLLVKFNELGPKWTTLAKLFPNRTDAMLKNRFKLLQRRARKLAKKGLTCGQISAQKYSNILDSENSTSSSDNENQIQSPSQTIFNENENPINYFTDAIYQNGEGSSFLDEPCSLSIHNSETNKSCYDTNHQSAKGNTYHGSDACLVDASFIEFGDPTIIDDLESAWESLQLDVFL
ncbi:hypothetical protein TRFO_30228 [Tritrichomonas foetus]|uniref:Myb-like DNA-binding domain containing protein n=1 Tax=Tritrichomonas foetus TaxID=1144522 RepID=A0A1J4JTW8_9EUKA|nr:hypothetical protein TRFO_30228 [Tritrichomonas foetus]|eukprot:OHT02569.1 hypothetical protein TRFO_30228 [Tritrichomonas foetus]